MCLAKVYLNGDESTPAVQSVTSLQQGAEGITVTTLFNEVLTFEGKLTSIDFTDSVIKIES